ncbi:MAG: hypothetical protein ACRCX5_06230, partial [Bacteroidales bacterium]
DADKDRAKYIWTTGTFKYQPKHNIHFSFFVKSEIIDGDPVKWHEQDCGDCRSVPAIVKVRLLDQNGNQLLSREKELKLQGHEQNWKLYHAFNFECDPVLVSQCAKAEISVSLKDGYAYNQWICPWTEVGKYTSFKFGIDNVKSGL